MTRRNGHTIDLPPQALDAEQAVIGCCLISREAATIRDVLAIVSADDFYGHHHRILFRTICQMHQAGDVADAVTLGTRLGDEFVVIIGHCLETVPHAAHAAHYARIIRKCSERRQFIDEMKQKIADAYDIQKPFGETNEAYHSRTIGDLIAENPHLDPPLIDGLLRVGETANIIAPAKVGKSWLVYGLALNIATGKSWLDRFPCRSGKVAIIDNELKRSVLAHRIKSVGDALQIDPGDYHDRIVPFCLRGKLLDLDGIGKHIISRIPHGEFGAIFVDAWYRVLPEDENNNGAMARAYNLIDSFAERTGAAWLLVHHSTKGTQGEKRVTDVGAGAGSQSRAADSHIILREHEESGVVVMEAAVRSFAPVEALPLRWTFPVWTPEQDIDPERLKGKKATSDEKQARTDDETKQVVVESLRGYEPSSIGAIRKRTGFSEGRASRGIRLLIADGDVIVHGKEKHPNGREYETYKLTD